MSSSLQEAQVAAGGRFEASRRIPSDFGDPAAELDAAQRACVLVDRTDCARLIGTGPDLLDLLHRLSTAAVKDLAPGQGRPTVLTTNKGRIVERLLATNLGDTGVLLVAGAGAAGRVLDHVTRFTFAEQIGLSDHGKGTALFVVLGPTAADALTAAGLATPPPYHATQQRIAERPVHVLGHDGWNDAGFALLVPTADADAVWSALFRAVKSVGGRPAGSRALEAHRVLRGIPDSGAELNEGHNPLEAGLWDAVDFDKGCYVGQEVVARLRTYDKVSRMLCGFVLALAPAPSLPRPGSEVRADNRTVGETTSCVTLPGSGLGVGLAFVKKRDAAIGDLVELLDAEAGPQAARLIALPMEIDPDRGGVL